MPAPWHAMPAVPRVALADLMPTSTCVAPGEFTTAAEKLAVALSKTGVAVVSLGPTKVVKQAKLQRCLQDGLHALLASGTSELPGRVGREWRAGAGAPATTAIEEAYGLMESTARAVLAALCRSSLLRLRGDALSPLLDDLPLARSTPSSSLLAAASYLDNFTALSAAERSAVRPLFADPQEELTERGLLTLVYAQEATSAEGAALSALQVQDRDGCWQGLELGPGEVAVVAGLALQHATAGLLRAAPHRVVGQPFGACSGAGAAGAGAAVASGRRALTFELRPHPAAVLDLRAQLAAAGHVLPARYAPVSMSSLAEQFESLLSPAAKLATPEQQEGAAAHAAWEALQTGAAGKRSRKRGSGTPAGAAVHLSGAVPLRSTEGVLTRRTSGRLAGRGQPASVDQEPQQQRRRRASSSGGGGQAWDIDLTSPTEDDATASLGSGGSSGGRSTVSGGTSGSDGSSRRASLAEAGAPGAAALYVRGGRTCIVVDGCLTADPAACLAICMRSFTGLEKWFYLAASCPLGRLFELYAARAGIGLGAVRFLLNGTRVFGMDSPASLKLVDGAELVAVPESSDRLQQARELGPLFASVFGYQAAAAAPANKPV